MEKKLNKFIIVMVVIIVIALIALIYKRNIKDTAKLKLNGLNEIVLYENDVFNDPGYQIIDNKESSNGYYVNQEKNLDLSKVGNYYIKYMLYNKNGKLLSEVTRQIVVLEDAISHIELKLNGSEEEYFFTNDYIDHGVIALRNGNDISNQIEVIDNVKSNLAGSYEVKYRITIDNKIKEIKRQVHIVDLNIEEKIDKEKLMINLTFFLTDFDYVILPDGTKIENQNIVYNFNDVGRYDFDIYLKSGSHKIHSVDIANVDKDGPNGTCIVHYEKNKTNVIMNAYDSSGIKKYSYNGLDFYNNTNSLEGIITGISIRTYDNMNNYSDIKCQAEYEVGFKEVNEKKSYVKCQEDFTKANNELDALMQSYGYKTRDAVAAAALYLANYDYHIGYRWGGKYTEKGFNPNWGCSKDTSRTKSGRLVCSNVINESRNTCQDGLDCSGYTAWAFIQAGFDKDIIRKSSQSEGMWGTFNAKAHRYTFAKNQDKVNLIKPGDIVHIEHADTGHVGIVIGVSDKTIQVANEHDGIRISIIRKSDGVSTNRDEDFTDFVLFDDFFNTYGN